MHRPFAVGCNGGRGSGSFWGATFNEFYIIIIVTILVAAVGCFFGVGDVAAASCKCFPSDNAATTCFVYKCRILQCCRLAYSLVIIAVAAVILPVPQRLVAYGVALKLLSFPEA